MKKEMTYTKAIEELEALVQEIESGNLTIDQLSSKVKDATLLVALCKKKLHETDQELAKILEELQ